MENKKLERIIRIVREDMMVGDGGYTGSAAAEGPSAGYDPLMKPQKKRKKYAYLGPKSRLRWMKKDV